MKGIERSDLSTVTNDTPTREAGGPEPSAVVEPASPSRGVALKTFLRRAVVWIPVAGLVIWTMAPFLISISVSFKEPASVFANPGLIPENFTLDAYSRVLERPGFRSALWNSIVIGLGSLGVTLVLGVPAAYAFARFRFRGRHLLLLFSLLPMLIPKVGLMVPLYRLAVRLDAIDSRLFLIVVFTGMLLPLATWLMVGFFQAIPRDLEEAAAVDGASLYQTLRRIVLPLSLPALITVSVLAFREAWNEFELVLALTQSSEARTLPYELFLMQTAVGIGDFPLENAFALLTVLPLILVYLRIERYVTQGLLTGSVK